MNKWYIRGSKFERQIIQDGLTKGAWLAQRGAGSKSYGKIKVDCIIFRKNEKGQDICELIQAKKGKSNVQSERKKFMALKIPKSVKLIKKFIINEVRK